MFTPSTPLTPHAAILLQPGEGETFPIIGGGIRVLMDGAASGGSVFQFESTVSAGEGPPLHRHEREDELFYVLEGESRFVLDGQEFAAAPGAFVCAPRGSVHTFQNTGSRPGRLLITCTPAGLDDAFRAVRLPEPGSAETPPTMEEMTAIFASHGVLLEGPPLS
jgi:quercetin dioxygenase-like cupin family protein